MLSCILLSAGASARFGSPKALAKQPSNNRPIIEKIQKTLLKTKIDEIIIVLGAHAESIKPFLLKHKNIKVVYNKDHNFGQTSSFKAGLKYLSPLSKGTLLLPVDYPTIQIPTINTLINTFLTKIPHILIPSFQGQKGHPPIFSSTLKKEFLDLNNLEGLNTISHHHKQNTVILPMNDSGIIQTFNTHEEFNKLIW